MTTPSLRSLAISLAALALVAGPAWSARVVQVRVGNHPKFTRVVFELDGKAGYQIERREVDGGEELVVTLAAASKPRKLSSQSAMIAGVEVEPDGQDSVARVRLRRSAPRVKEMILASPPRIVLDLMLPDELAHAGGAKKAPPATAAAPGASGERAPAPRVVAKRDDLETSRPKAEAAKPETKAKAGPAAEPRPAAKAPAPGSKATPPDDAVARPQKAEPPTPGAVAAPPVRTPGAKVEAALEGERIVEAEPEPREEGAESEAAGATPAPAAPAPTPPVEPVAKPLEGTPPKPVAKTPATPAPSAEKPGFFSAPFGLSLEGADPRLTMFFVGGGALLFLVVVVMLLRKHSKPTALDALGMARPGGGSLGAGESFGTGSGAGAEVGRGEAYPRAGSGLFDDDSEKGDMEMAAQLPIERERTRMAQTPIGADSDLGPLVRELERRVGQLESRLDQVNEARERLERQVTAQSEELRVQRAAIARTQRALRGMTRTGEEQATEPALRDPSRPTTPRS